MSKGGFRRAVLKVFGGERRQSITVPIFAVLLSLIAASILLLALGKNPITAFLGMLRGCGIVPKANYAANAGMLTDFMSFLGWLAPMTFAALAVAVAFKTGLFNIGISGQMLLGGFFATVVALECTESVPTPLRLVLVLAIGIASGAAVGGLIGFLKYKFNINEVVSSIMLNYIIQYVTKFFIQMYYVDPVSRQSRYIDASWRLTVTDVQAFGVKFDIPLAVILVIPAILIVRLILDRTKLGYEMKTVGLTRSAARYAGMNVGKNMVLSMLISGALAGLAGVSYYLGYYASIQPGVLAGMGFDSIAVSLLGNSNPVGIFFSSFLITIVSKGATYMSSSASIPQEIAQVITGLILLFSACGVVMRSMLARLGEREREYQKSLAAPVESVSAPTEAERPDKPTDTADATDAKGGDR